MSKKAIIIGGLIGIAVLAVAALFVYVLYTGPRMTVQPHIRAFQALAPRPPAGTATVEVPEQLPAPGKALSIRNPLPPTRDTISRGQVYYGYYCVFCHGEQGDGNGPVGESYMPRPADLRSGKVRGYSDGQLLRAMLTGIGHEPVLEQVVPPRQRWYLVQYLRTL